MSLDEFGWSVGLGNSFDGSKCRLMDLMVFFLNNERLVGVNSSSYRIVRDVPKYCRYE